MRKLLVSLLILICGNAYSGEVGLELSIVSQSSLEIDSESESNLGTIFTASEGMQVGLSYYFESGLNFGTNVFFTKPLSWGDEDEEEFKYKSLSSNIYIGYKFSIFRPFIGLEQMNIEYKNISEDIDETYNGSAFLKGISIYIHENDKFSSKLNFVNRNFEVDGSSAIYNSFYFSVERKF